jgi:hypothetical protein
MSVRMPITSVTDIVAALLFCAARAATKQVEPVEPQLVWPAYITLASYFCDRAIEEGVRP